MRARAIATARPLLLAMLLTSAGASGGTGIDTRHAPLAAADDAGRCMRLASVGLDGATITSARLVAAGAARVANKAGQEEAVADLPAFCRVQATMTPVTGSKIGVEVWLPAQGWNGRLLGTGNGGGAGRLVLGNAMRQNLQRGFAVANTDLGTAPDILTTMKQPERWRDFGYRANHEMTRAARAFVSAYYGKAPHHAYFTGCSTGGQQALVNAQRYPNDYDGILVGAPANDRTHIHASFVWNWNTLVETPGSRLSAAKLSFINMAVRRACAGKDGGLSSDVFLTDPRRCGFDPATLPRCSGTDGDDCLTAPQLTALRKLYAGAVNPRTGERIFAPIVVGTEAMPLGPVTQQTDGWPPQQFYPFYWTFGREAFVPARFDFDRDMDRVDGELAGIMNANDVDLGDFRRHGGKILWYHGLMDPGIPFDGSVDYYDRAVAAAGGDLGKVQSSMRLFLIPGMGHCGGGPGPWNIGQDVAPGTEASPDRDALIALVDWVEQGRAPDRLIASQQRDDRQPVEAQRPVCAYPAMPAYRRGDPRAATSFTCVKRPPGGVHAVAARYLR